MKEQERLRLRAELAATIRRNRDDGDDAIFAALRAKLDELDPPKTRREKRDTRDRQQTEGYDRGAA
jgi:hypothetical protein